MTFETFIPPRANNVLEITGEVGENFQTTQENFLAIQPDCKYIVEKNFVDGDEKFDAIILQNNLIENLSHDELVALIKKFSAKLQKRGTLIFTLNNIAYAENVMSILEEKPPKFKTTLTKVELEQAIVDADLNRLRAMNAARRMNLPRSLVEISKTDVSVFMHIITATPEELPPKTLIQYSIGENLVCAPIRIHMPNSFFVTEPNISTSAALSGQAYKLFTKKDFGNRIFINQRISFNSFAKGKKLFDQLNNAGYLYISEMDDHPILWENDYQNSGYINFVSVHAVQTSTKYLADFLSQYNPHVKIFPNQLRRLLPERNFDAEFQQKDRPVTIFFGALNRDKEFNELLPILNQFAKDYGKKISFKILARQKWFDSLQAENKILVGDPAQYDAQFVPYARYEDALKTSDIALLPLQDNKFNRAKSDLKFIECANAGTVALASPVVYSDVVKDGENGFIFKDLKDFSAKLKLLIDNADKRRAVAENAYNYVKHNRLMSQHYEERLNWYFELLAKLPELTAEAQARIEKLAPQFKDEPPELPQQNNPEGFLEPNAEIIIPV